MHASEYCLEVRRLKDIRRSNSGLYKLTCRQRLLALSGKTPPTLEL